MVEGLAAGGCARAGRGARGHPRGRTRLPGRPQRHAHREGDAAHHGPAGPRARPNRRRHRRSGSSPTRSTRSRPVWPARSRAAICRPTRTSWFSTTARQQARDEGRAMAEIVYDTAPGSRRSSSPAEPEPAERQRESASIDALVAAGAKVIVDDIVLPEPSRSSRTASSPRRPTARRPNGSGLSRLRRQPCPAELGGRRSRPSEIPR